MFFSATLVNSLTLPECSHGAPQQPAVGVVALDAVAFVDLDEVLADVGLLVLDEARRETR